MRTKNILIAGAGNIGFYYFEALKKVDFDLRIYIYDISNISIQNFKKKIEKNKTITVFYIKNLKALPYYLDLAIISSPSNKRYLLIQEIFKFSRVKNLIVEKVIEQSLENLKKLKKLINKTNTFISFPRRCSEIYQYLKKKKLKKLHFLVIGAKWGLACNGIHFLDIISWISRKKIKIINTSGLTKWYKSKRKGYDEVDGEVSLIFNENVSLKLVSRDNVDNIIKINSGSNLWTLEKSETLLKKNGKILKKTKKSLSISELMKNEINQILKNKKTNLPKFNEIYLNHAIYIKKLLKNWNNFHRKKKKILPIT